MLKAGFIGAGGRAQSAHYPSLTRLDDVEVTAVCELDETILAQVAQEYNIPNTFTDHRDMLDKMDLDIVYCVMREAWVLQPALDCLNAGKHTFLEKPPGANSDQTQKMLDAAVANDVYAMVGFQRRYAAVTREAMRRVAAKGPVSLVTISRAFAKLPPDELAQVKALFISLDPERDTPEMLKQYTGYFHSNIIGLTERPEHIAQIAEKYGVKHEKKELLDSALGYVISHSADIYVVDPQGKLCASFPHDTDLEPLLVQIKRLLNSKS